MSPNSDWVQSYSTLKLVKYRKFDSVDYLSIGILQQNVKTIVGVVDFFHIEKMFFFGNPENPIGNTHDDIH